MSTTPFDPDLLRPNSPMASGEMRCQLVALDAEITTAISNSAGNADGVAAL
jgi:hypothetical protein